MRARWYIFYHFAENLEALERGQMVKDYNMNSTNSSSNVPVGGSSVHSQISAESEDEEDPRTPTSVSSQGSQGYDSAGSDFVDIEGFQTIADSSLPELNLQVQNLDLRVTTYKIISMEDVNTLNVDPRDLATLYLGSRGPDIPRSAFDEYIYRK